MIGIVIGNSFNASGFFSDRIGIDPFRNECDLAERYFLIITYRNFCLRRDRECFIIRSDGECKAVSILPAASLEKLGSLDLPH